MSEKLEQIVDLTGLPLPMQDFLVSSLENEMREKIVGLSIQRGLWENNEFRQEKLTKEFEDEVTFWIQSIADSAHKEGSFMFPAKVSAEIIDTDGPFCVLHNNPEVHFETDEGFGFYLTYNKGDRRIVQAPESTRREEKKDRILKAAFPSEHQSS